MCTARNFVRSALGAVLLISAAGAPAAAEDFYKGKQITLIVASGVGAAYDAYARLLIQYMPAHIPGNPTIVVQLMSGAAGLTAARHMFSVAPRDGTVFSSGVSNLPTAPLLAPDAAPYDTTKFSWIGSITKDPYIGYVWHTSAIQTLEDAKTKVATMGATGTVGSASFEMAIISNDFFGTKFRMITGYKDTNETKFAIERGELDGTFANAWSSFKISGADWLRDKKVRIITQHGFEKHPDLPDVPLFMDQAKTTADRQALELLLGRQEYSKPYFAPPEVPADRMAILRRAFDATVHDPEFLAAAEKQHLDVVGPMTGEQLAEMVKTVMATPKPVVQRVEGIFDDIRSGKRK
jgi:tripartite-type tricarboxylate transporter receptor subunit TctC